MGTAIGCFALGIMLANVVHTDGLVRGIAWAVVCSLLGLIFGIIVTLSLTLF
jgi:hypothetical protein